MAFGLRPLKQLRLSHRFLHERGDFLLLGGGQLLEREGGRPHGGFVVGLSRPRDGKTLMRMIQRGLPTAELRTEHLAGLPNAFACLERAIEK
jgi:hypothetical protein